MQNNPRTFGGSWLQKSQVGPLHLYLLGERCRFYPDPVRRRCSLLGKDLVLRRIKQKLLSRFSITDMGDVSLVLGMGVTRDRDEGTVTITQEKEYHVPAGTLRHGKLRFNVHVWAAECTLDR